LQKKPKTESYHLPNLGKYLNLQRDNGFIFNRLFQSLKANILNNPTFPGAEG
jgi:hypothetical protein